jgi:hypothetical protein
MFREHVPKETGDFTKVFQDTGLHTIFTSDKVATKMLGPAYNCNMVYRQTKVMPDIVLFSDDNYLVLHPLGEPGRDLGNHPNRIAHLMVVRHTDDGNLFNEMLPSSPEELGDLSERLAIFEKAYRAIRQNPPISECGAKTLQRASDMGLPSETPLRTFFAKQIASLTPQFRLESKPGYLLLDREGNDVADKGEDFLESLIGDVFGNDSLTTLYAIQGPSDCSQLLSHIHGFLLDKNEIPERLRDVYICAESIWELKRATIVPDGLEPMDLCSEEEEGCELIRTDTRPHPISKRWMTDRIG